MPPTKLKIDYFGKAKEQPLLVADVGGTNVRFGIVYNQEESVPLIACERSFVCADYSSFDEAMSHYLESIDTRVSRACIAVAGPVFSGSVEMTNLKWQLNEYLVSARFGLQSTMIINDFVAQAMSVSVVHPARLETLRDGISADRAQRVVLGAGTGLGVAGLIWTNHWHAVSSEAGHMMYAPHSKLEQEVHKILKAKFGFVSLERILSGPGLINVYEAIAAIHDQTAKPYAAKDIDHLARSEQDPLCQKTIEFFSTVLGGCAADFALTFHADGGVFLGGGVLNRMRDQISSARFNQGYLRNTVKRDYLETLPVYLLNDEEPGLEGAAVYATRTR